MRFLLRLAFTWAAVVLTDRFMDHVTLRDIPTGVVTAVVLTLLEAFVKPVLVFLTLPLTLLTLGILLFVINGVVVLICARLVDGFQVSGLGSAIAFSIGVSICMWLFGWAERLFGRSRDRQGG